MIWSIPGGHIEGDESTIEGLIRELYEEAAVIVKKEDCKPFFIQKTYKKIDTNWVFDEYQARYIIRKFKIEKFIQDPDQENPIVHQKFFSLSSLKEHLKWGSTTDFLIKNLENISDQII